MDLSKLWLWYCEQHLSAADLAAQRTRALSPDEVMECFWTFHPLFTGRMDAIKATPYSTDFDDSADEALGMMAMEDSFALWDALPAGTWRVLYERFSYCSVVVAANMAAGTVSIDRVPAGLSSQATARALLLRYLLGHGRTIDRKVLPPSAPGTAPSYPVSATIRRQ
jgi:hypothetical protein